jgi:hypothetical protein
MRGYASNHITIVLGELMSMRVLLLAATILAAGPVVANERAPIGTGVSASDRANTAERPIRFARAT